MKERRIVVIGTSGAGKTTLAKELARKLGIMHIELDELHWAPDWVEVPDEVMRERADRIFTKDGGWAVDGNYGQVRDIVWDRAEILVWLDYNFPTVFFRALRRTIRRLVRRETLWHGNRETWRMTFLSKDSILLWVITSHHRRARQYPKLISQPEFSHLKVIRLKDPREAGRWLKKIEPLR